MIPRSAFPLALLACLAAPVALAGAPPREPVPEGTWIKLFDLGPKDAWYPHRARLTDLHCQVGPGALRPHKATWFDGQVRCEDGLDYVFRQATFSLLAARDGDGTDCPPGAWNGGPLGAGSRVRLLDVRSTDAFYGMRREMIGEAGHVIDELFDNGSRSCWLGGEVATPDGQEWFFFEAAFAVDHYVSPRRPSAPVAPVASSCPEGAYTGPTLGDGSEVEILAVHTEDAYHDIRIDFEGRGGTVSGDLHNNGECWYGGGMVRDDGTYAYFYKVAVRVTATVDVVAPPDCAAGVVTDGSIPKGHRVRIVDVHPDDAYYPTRDKVTGRVGTTQDALERIDACWFAGPVLGENGEDWYFFKASMVDLGTPQ